MVTSILYYVAQVEAAKERYHAVAEAKTDEADAAEAHVAQVDPRAKAQPQHNTSTPEP